MRHTTTSLNEKLKSSQQTPANKADPKMSIQVSRARMTVMDSDYWTVESIREKTNLGDIGVAPRRFTPYGQPNRIYEIHVDNGTIGTSIREYPDTFKDGWKDQFTLGAGSSVALAFDGNWQRYRSAWRLVTEEKPWIFWVDSGGALWRQLWDDESSLSQLDSSVTYVRAIRAWRNLYSSELDQGIVVGYIKTDGTAWYRNYCRQADGTVTWEVARQIPSISNAVHLNLFLTNDYRVGFCIEKSNKEIQWIITQRNWAGMALIPENIQASLVLTEIKLIPIAYSDQNVVERIDSNIRFGKVSFCPTDVIINFSPSIIRAKRIDSNSIEIEYDTELYEAPNCPESFTISNNSIVEVSKSDTKTLKLTTADTLVSVGSWTVTYDGLGGINSFYSEYCKPEFGSFSVLATGEPPSVFESIVPNLMITNIDFIQCDFSNFYSEERIDATLGMVTVELIKIGTNPL
jgi:hypothetical protein